jgi:hypothetical protein
MKTTIIIPVLIAVYAVLNIPAVICQPIRHAAIVALRTEQIDTPKNNRDFYPLNGKNSPNNLKILRSFLKDFKGVENVSWFKAANGGCVAQFIKDSVQITARYSSNGTWNYTLKRYAEKKMSGDLRTLVKKSFFDYAIQEVVEITVPNEEDVIYRIMIKNGKGFKILMICREEMQVIEDYAIG